MLGRPASARRHLERALALYDPAEHRGLALDYAYDQRVVARDLLACALFVLGYPDQAEAQIRRSLAEAEALRHRASLAHALDFACLLDQLRDDPTGVLSHAAGYGGWRRSSPSRSGRAGPRSSRGGRSAGRARPMKVRRRFVGRWTRCSRPVSGCGGRTTWPSWPTWRAARAVRPSPGPCGRGAAPGGGHGRAVVRGGAPPASGRAGPEVGRRRVRGRGRLPCRPWPCAPSGRQDVGAARRGLPRPAVGRAG